MPSRRRLLGAVGAAAVTGFGGCLSTVGLAATGYLQMKAVNVRWSHRGRRYLDQLLWILHRIGEGRIDGRYDPRYVGDAVSGPDDIAVSDTVHEALDARFERVEYAIGFCTEQWSDAERDVGCLNAGASQEDFNWVQLDDRLEAMEREDSVDVLDVYPDQYPVEAVELHEMDFAALHADHGVPEPPAR